ncbi:MAG: thiamine phosphate synthase [Candidatus Aegiribacteria sp.]|nr:thiamine phosphate synthase [Candidatus Aegiribacteria sp.]
MRNPEQLYLYLVTDPLLCGSRGVVETCRLALGAGVGALQLRDKNASTRELIQMAVILQNLCRRHRALFIVNDRVDVALATGADGVHLGQDDMPVLLARKILGPDPVIGASARSPREAESAWKEGADYIAANLIFPTDTKTDLGEPLGTEAVTELKKVSPLPLVAIGGINASNADIVRKAGADGIAVVSAIMAAEDVPDVVRALLKGRSKPGRT